MRWPRARHAAGRARPAVDPVVLSVTSPLNRATALDLARRLERLDPAAPVVIDLTAIPAFDSDGAEAVLDLQQAHQRRGLSIVGLRQATARLVGTDEQAPATPAWLHSGWVQRRLRNLVVVQPFDERNVTAQGLEPALAAAGESDSAIVVVDLRGVETLDRATLDAIAFSSSAAALHGQEMLVVNVSAPIADALRSVALSATTYVAPEPPGS